MVLSIGFNSVAPGCALVYSPAHMAVPSYLCILNTWSAMVASRCGSFSSRTMKSKSKRESSESGSPMFFTGGRLQVQMCQGSQGAGMVV